MEKHVNAAELLKLKSFSSKVKLVNPEADLYKEITHVTIMESPDLYRWVTGGELVLTTWYAFSNNPEYQEEYFRNLTKKISAIGIKTHRFIDEIPEKILKIANEENVPVFEVGYSVRFRELVTIVNSQIQNYQTNMLLEVEDFSNRLIKQSLNSDNIDSLLKLLSSDLNTTVFCMDHKMTLIAYISNEKKKKHIEDDCEEIKYLFKENNGDSYIKLNNLHIFKCFSRNKMIGTLVIYREGKLQEKEKIMAQQTTHILAMKLWNIYETEQKQQIKFWKNLTLGRINVTEISLMLKKFGLNLNNENYLCLFKHSDVFSDWDPVLNKIFPNNFIVEEETYTIMLCNSKEFLKQLNLLKKYIEKHGYDNLIIVTSPFKDVTQIKNRYSIAVNVLNLLNEFNTKGIKLMEDYLVYSLLKPKKDTPEYDYIVFNVLKPLIDYDNDYKSNLLPTLYNALTCESIDEAAKKLFIHVNTLRYRLNKIQQLVGKDFFVNKDKMMLLSAVFLWKFSE